MTMMMNSETRFVHKCSPMLIRYKQSKEHHTSAKAAEASSSGISPLMRCCWCKHILYINHTSPPKDDNPATFTDDLQRLECLDSCRTLLRPEFMQCGRVYQKDVSSLATITWALDYNYSYYNYNYN